MRILLFPLMCDQEHRLCRLPVRLRNPPTGFVRPAPYPAKPSKDSFWFGTDRLWTALPVNGKWSLGHYWPNDPTFRQKLFFWRQGYDPHTEASKLMVTGRRIDSPAPPLLTDGPGSESWTLQDSFTVTGINFPTLGCWEVTGHDENDEVTFVIWIAK